MLSKDTYSHSIRKHRRRPPPMEGGKGTHRAEAETNRVNIHCAVNAQSVYFLWANPVGIEQYMFSIYSHLHGHRKQPPQKRVNKLVSLIYPNWNLFTWVSSYPFSPRAPLHVSDQTGTAGITSQQRLSSCAFLTSRPVVHACTRVHTHACIWAEIGDILGSRGSRHPDGL